MASSSAHDDDDVRKGNDDDNDRDVPRYWNAYELQAVCALVCKGAHLKGSLSFATKLNTTLNGSGSYENDIDIEDIEELLGKIEKNKKAALAFALLPLTSFAKIERQGTSRITRTQRRVFERNLGFDGTLAEWEGGRKQKVMQARQARQAALDEKAKGSHYTAIDGTRIDRWTPSIRTETGQTVNRVVESGNSEEQVINTNTQDNNALLTRDVASPEYQPPTPAWGYPITTQQPPGWGYYTPRSAESGIAWGAMDPATSQGSTPPWRSAQQQSSGSMGTPSAYYYGEPARYPDQRWGGPTYEGSERRN
ncbi:hypothetical protein PG997_003598 [Apiospora hydei]|uniref:Uncharacterized protein n=1 Tax=Apiospora hydei TaxID=1337664 RepID=A0ABR1WZV8_9PEZI